MLAKTARHGGSPYGLALADGVPFAYVRAGQRVVTVDATRPLAAKSWSYLAATYDGTSLELYVEGVGVADDDHFGTNRQIGRAFADWRRCDQEAGLRRRDRERSNLRYCTLGRTDRC